MSKVCVKVAHLRKIGYSDLKEWMEDSRNVYVGRRGRIFITKNGNKSIYHYHSNKYANPYKVDKETSLSEVLEKYRNYLDSSGLINDINELKGKNLGCFCDQNTPCHAQMLVDLIKEKQSEHDKEEKD
jgi:hypothetical protein